jgi:hypothetical protein
MVIQPNQNSEDTNDIYHQLYGSLDPFQSLVLEDNLINCFIHLPMSENIPFILTYANIAQAQPGDAQLQLMCAQKPNQYTQTIGTQSGFMVLSQSPRPTLAYLFATRHA